MARLRGRRNWHGLHISIEHNKGDVRSGTSRDGTPWQRRMHAAYGYLLGTTGQDGEHLDAYLGPDLTTATKVYIAHQVNPDTGAYDEDKALIGYRSVSSARAAYLKHYPSAAYLGGLSEIDADEFADLVRNGAIKGKRTLLGRPRAKTDTERATLATLATKPLIPNTAVIIEALAARAHETWMTWAQHLMDNERISAKRRARWKTMMIPYSQLPETEKDKDRTQARLLLGDISDVAAIPDALTIRVADALAKAADLSSAAPRLGLIPKRITHTDGHVVTHWVRPDTGARILDDAPAAPTPPGGMDPFSAALFSGERRVTITNGAEHVEAAERNMLGRALTDEERADLIGAPAGADIRVIYQNINSVRYEAQLFTDDPDPDGGTDMHYQLKQEGDLRILLIDIISMTPLHQGRGMGTRMFARQVATARNLGVNLIEADATGAPGGYGHGYYVWPRLGFNMNAGYHGEVFALANHLPQTPRTVQDIFLQPGGAKYWREHGQRGKMFFNPDPDSISSRALQHYLDAKGIRVTDAGEGIAKADGIAPRPGLMPQRITHSDGRVVTHWVRTEPPKQPWYAYVPDSAAEPAPRAAASPPPAPGNAMDPFSALLFTGERHVTVVTGIDLGAVERAERNILGRTLTNDERADLIGAPAGTDVQMFPKGDDYIEISMRMYGDDPAKPTYLLRYLSKDHQTGEAQLRNEIYYGASAHNKTGLATRILAREIMTARKLGIRRITTYADGNPANRSETNGYYTWARLGYNAPLDPSYARVAAHELGAARPPVDLQELFGLPGGARHWFDNGRATAMSFDLDPDSTSSRAFQHYLDAKGINVHDDAAGESAAKAFAAPRPGLTQRRITHRDGRVVRHWVRDNPTGRLTPAPATPPPSEPAPQEPRKAARPAPTSPTPAPDEFSALLFDGDRDVRVIYGARGSQRRMFGKHLTELEMGDLIGAPGGSSVTASGELGDARMTINASIPTIESGRSYMKRIVQQRGDEPITMHNEEFVLAKEHQGVGIATRAFAMEVATARRLGVQAIHTLAVGNRQDSAKWNGYYTWARLGFDAPLSPAHVRAYAAQHNIPPEDAPRTLQALFLEPDGGDWWKEHGTTTEMTFDLDPTSVSSRALQHYLDAKGIVIPDRTGHPSPLVGVRQEQLAFSPVSTPNTKKVLWLERKPKAPARPDVPLFDLPPTPTPPKQAPEPEPEPATLDNQQSIFDAPEVNPDETPDFGGLFAPLRDAGVMDDRQHPASPNGARRALAKAFRFLSGR